MSDSARNLSLQLTTYGSYTSLDGGGGSPDVASGRQVWVLIGEYPEYEHYRFGKMEDVQVTTVLDAETGEMLMTKTVGKFLEEIRPSNVTPVVGFPDQ